MSTTAYPPGPPGRYPGAHLVAFGRDPLGFVTRVARTYGDVAHGRLGRQHLYLLSHPDYVQDVLVTAQRRFTGLAFEASRRITGGGLLSAQGAEHRRRRRLVQPAFHRERFAAYGAAMAAHARQWCDAQEGGAEVAVRPAMRRLTLAIVGETMFGAADADAADDVGALLAAGLALFGPVTFLFARWTEGLPLPRARLDARITRMLQERRASAADRGDLLSMLLAALDEEGDGRGLTDRQVRAEIVTVFLAGHETTASALTWSWWLLAHHPEAERRLHEELDAVLVGRPPTADDLPRLPYTAGVFAEALRLYPPAATLFRRALEHHSVGAYVIPRGGVVLLSPYVVQRDPRFYPDPEAFDPERWAPEARAARPRFSYFPFGGGARVCIGEGFALMEGALVLATIAQHWRLRPGVEPPPEPRRGTRPSDALRLRLERRVPRLGRAG